ncbi:Gfo/Idh/MocA family oxidoreductase [Roseibium sp.]|uniref:Gfo/Idh/MocA family protein n=1 Tax=Roseibium sp. TaxID=1936156 RepID=UPI0032671492
MAKRVGLAVVGLGMGAAPHAQSLQDLEDVIDVRGVYARSEPARRAFADTYGFRAADDLDALVGDPDVDGLLLITPPNVRAGIISRFAEAGKHILCEKPLERTVAAAEGIVRICEDADVRLGVVFQHRFRPASEKLAALIVSGELGPIRLVRADIPWWRGQDYYDEPGRGTYERDGGGVLMTQAIHMLDLMMSLIPPVTAVQALTATTALHTMEAEDVCAGAFEFEGGVGSLFASTASFPGGAESLTLECEQASVLLQSGVLTVSWRDGRCDRFGEEAVSGGGSDPMAFKYHWHKAVIADFADAIAAGRPPRITGRQALAAHRLIDALERSSREGLRVAMK